MEFKKSTEAESKYKHLEQMSVNELLLNINKEDKTVPDAVEKIIPKIEALVNVMELIIKSTKSLLNEKRIKTPAADRAAV